MAADIYQNGPITGMFFVKQDFLAYKSGVYEPKLLSPPLGGHAIKIMGFGTEDGKDYWLVANSWNEDWGYRGGGRTSDHRACHCIAAATPHAPVAASTLASAAWTATSRSSAASTSARSRTT